MSYIFLLFFGIYHSYVQQKGREMKHLIAICAAFILQSGVQHSFAAVDYTTFAGYSKPTVGTGGTEVTVSSASDLVSAAASSGKKIIKISGSISNALIVCTSDKSFIGVGTNANLTESSFLIKDVSNVIIQNITMTLPYPGTVKGSDHDGDVIHIEGSSASDVWIDHCELYNKYDGVGKDDYDGIIDIKKGSTKVTVSWCYIHDAWKTSLIGYTETDNADWQVCYHHNLFNYVNSRLPSIRGGTGAMFNNYYLNIPGTAINTRVGATVYAEKNYFEGVGSGVKETYYVEGPIGSYYSDEVGTWNGVDNVYVSCLGNQPTNVESTTSYKPSFISSSSSVIIPAADVPAATIAYAGIIGKTKTLKNPTTGIAPVSQIHQTKALNCNSANTAMFTIRGEKITASTLNTKTQSSGVYIIKNGSSTIQAVKSIR